MFLELILQDIIVIEPELLDKNMIELASQQLKRKYTGKIIRGKGICIKVIDFELVESIIGNGSGNIEIKINFKCLLFSSFRGELLSAVISNVDEKGIYLEHAGVPAFVPVDNMFKNT